MMKPIININGATRESHVDARLIIMQNLRTVMEDLQEIKPHGRDYLGNTERYNADLNIYIERFKLLDKMFNEIQEEALAIRNDT